MKAPPKENEDKAEASLEGEEEEEEEEESQSEQLFQKYICIIFLIVVLLGPDSNNISVHHDSFSWRAKAKISCYWPYV